jgi:hypothetical protein
VISVSNRKQNFQRYFLFVVVVALWCLLCIENSPAQPGGCFATFNPFRTCNSHYISSEFVFVAQVVSRDEKLIEIDGRQLWKVRVSITEAIKGNSGGGTIDLFLEQRCRGTVEESQRYIFTADRIRKGDFDKLVSSHWSTTLKDIPGEELKKILGEIRSASKGIRQARLVGKAIQYDSNPLGIYDFQGKSLDTKSGYNPQYSSPLKGVEVIARPLDENLNPLKRDSFRTETNADGNYEFKDLPPGFYELSLNLPEDLYVRAYLYEPSEIPFENPFRPIRGKKIYIEIRDKICSEDIRFNVRPAGKIRGKLIFEDKAPAEEPFLRLLWVESETQRNDLKWAEAPFFEIHKSTTKPENTLEFLYSDLQVGRYILKIIFDFQDEQKNLYYPGVREIKDAEIINIKAGEIKDISIKLK